jgi:ribonucleoside-diphosphate reductase alpha chain
VSQKARFKTPFAEHIFRQKYALSAADSWDELARRVVDDVCGTRGGTETPILGADERRQLEQYIAEMKFIPGGRYLYYAGRKARFYNNCFLLRAEEDSREEWAAVTRRAMSCLMTGGGIGIDYSVLRPNGRLLGRTGGKASGPIPLMHTVNEVGRNVMQGGSRRSAIYASLNWQHEDAPEFLTAKNWTDQKVGTSGLSLWDVKQQDFNFPAPLDMTNISLNYDDKFLHHIRDTRFLRTSGKESLPSAFLTNCRQAMMTGEPGFSFNFGEKENETLRNACTEVTSEDDSDVCNLGSVNLGNCESLEEFRDVVQLASKFLVCGTVRAELPYEKVRQVRERNRRLGLGLMGIHEWLLKKGKRYEVDYELREWLDIYRSESERAAVEHCNRLYLSHPVAYRAIAPTGSIGILASTTTGIEPLYAIAYKRRYLAEGTKWRYEYVVDATADSLIKTHGLKPSSIETAASLANDVERRIKFQADVQDYVDMAISSTINLPAWGTVGNNESRVADFADTLARYCHRLRGFTCYPDGARGGQPLELADYEEAVRQKGVVFEENDVCLITGKGGVCGS